MKPATQSKKTSSRRPVRQHTNGQTVHFEISDPAARDVRVAGTFNDWKPELGQMARLGNGKWAKDLKLKPGTYEYRLIVDGQWKPDPNADHTVVNPFGERNSVLTVSS